MQRYMKFSEISDKTNNKNISEMRFLENQTEKVDIFINDEIPLYYKFYFHLFSSCFHLNGY